jgi:hypothetical protein
MGRAPNPGAPQRVSAHVVPKAPSFSASAEDEDEKTTIESGGWEEEASTTVEQGEVAEKVRALGALGTEARRSGSNTNITSTDGSGVSDEPTVDDQRASAALALLPPPSVARLVVTGGNDSGRSLEVRPGKTYTVGRGVDNDLVLTDITASRKHFDVRSENGSWILVDRGSGNGTLVNSRIEDAPFMLASGDTIEVGNTAFRFDLVSSAISLPGLPREVAPVPGRREAPPPVRPAPPDLPRLNPEDPDSVELATPAVGPERPGTREGSPPPALREEAAMASARGADPHQPAKGGPHEVPGVPTYDGSVDDDLEMSTVSGKPLASAEPARPTAPPNRPKTLPPPAPLPRPRTQTGRPPLAPVGYALDRPGPRSQQIAAPPLPLPPVAMASAMAATISPMHAPALLPQPATTLPLPQMANRPPMSPALLDPSHGPLPTTLPGQGPPLPARGPRLPFSYPSVTDIISQHAVSQHAPGNPRGPVHVTGHAGRDATSTALVQPMSYSGGQAALAPRVPRAMPPLSRRTKIGLGITALGVFAAIATLSIIRAASSHSDPAEAASAAATRLTPPVREPAAAPRAARPPTVTPIPTTAPARTPAMTTGSGSAALPRSERPPTPAVTTQAPGVAATTTAPAPTAPAPTALPITTPPPAPSTIASVSPANPTRSDRVASTAPAPTAPAPTVPAPTAPAPTVPAPPANPTPPEPSPPTATATAESTVKADRIAATSPGSRGDSRNDRRPTRRVEPRRPDRADRKPVEVAVAAPRADKKHGGRSMQDVKAEAGGLYKTRNFSGAAQLLTSSLSGFGSDDAKELKSIAAIYAQLGRAYNIGMAPGTKATEAYQALRRAIDYDRDVGSAYIPEMQDKLSGVATRAASSYMASHEYELAFQAVRMAESLGSKSTNNATVRTLLEETASDLYRTAQSELASDPDGAKKKARQILGMVDTRNPLYARAQKLINGP